MIRPISKDDYGVDDCLLSRIPKCIREVLRKETTEAEQETNRAEQETSYWAVGIARFSITGEGSSWN